MDEQDRQDPQEIIKIVEEIKTPLAKVQHIPPDRDIPGYHRWLCPRPRCPELWATLADNEPGKIRLNAYVWSKQERLYLRPEAVKEFARNSPYPLVPHEAIYNHVPPEQRKQHFKRHKNHLITQVILLPSQLPVIVKCARCNTCGKMESIKSE